MDSFAADKFFPIYLLNEAKQVGVDFYFKNPGEHHVTNSIKIYWYAFSSEWGTLEPHHRNEILGSYHLPGEASGIIEVCVLAH